MSKLRAWAQPALSVLRWEGVVLFAALGLGIVSALATRWFVAFVSLSAVFLYLAWMRAFGSSEASAQFRERARTLGLGVWGVLLALIGLAIFWRFSHWWTATLFLSIYLAIGAWHLVWLARRGGEAAGLFRQSVALTILPILAAWFINSTVWQVWTATAAGFGYTDIDEAALEQRREARSRQLDGAESTIAIALSGGGYRAAAVHAGVLSVLEQAGLPVAYLSTVSGGSIVGGAYSMGMSAAEFRDRLMSRKPGLPNDVMNFYAVFAQLFVPGYGSGDTYASHFDRVYFDGSLLGETGPPELIVNATRYRDGTRRAFWRARDGGLSLARAVAASGAFPVAFDPVTIEGERYIDGGVVENLGIAGLQQYFANGVHTLPKVLIISDGSLIPAAPSGRAKPSVVEMAMRAQQTSYFAMHRWIYSFYTDGAYDRAANGALEQPFVTTAGRLWPDIDPALRAESVSVFVLSPSSPAERKHYAGHEALLDAVSGLETLKELDAGDVEAAFWVGATLAAEYLPALCAAAVVECRSGAPVPPPGVQRQAVPL